MSPRSSSWSDLLTQLVMESPLADVLLECHSLFLWSTNTHFGLQVFQELFESTVNSESIKMTSNREVFSRPASETRNQSRNRKAMITWVRASLVHEDIKLKVIKELCVYVPTLAQSWDCCWLGVAPRRIRPIVPALAAALTSPWIIPIPPRIVVKLLLWFCCFRRPPPGFL